MTERRWLTDGKFNGGVDDTSHCVPEHHYVEVDRPQHPSEPIGLRKPQHIMQGAPIRSPGLYTFGTTERRNEDEWFIKHGWTVCCACVRKNKPETHIRPRAFQQHVLNAHQMDYHTYSLTFAGSHGYDALALIEHVL